GGDAASSGSVDRTSISSPSISSLRELRRSGRSSVTVTMSPSRERATLRPTLSPLDQDDVASGAALSDRPGFPVLRRFVPQARVGEARKLEDDEPGRLPASLERSPCAAAGEVAPFVLGHDCRAPPPVVLVSRGVRDLDISDDVRGHGSSSM